MVRPTTDDYKLILDKALLIEENGGYKFVYFSLLSGDKNKAKLLYQDAIRLMDVNIVKLSKNPTQNLEKINKHRRFRKLVNDRLDDLKNKQHSHGTSSSQNDLSSQSNSTGLKKIKQAIQTKVNQVSQELKDLIINNVLSSCDNISFDQIAGQKTAKDYILESLVYPICRPDLFTGLREPVRGFLMYGPPGNGKTMLAKAIATECNRCFFNMSGASIMSKWLGESEKTVHALFECARAASPSIIFIDEAETILGTRTDDSTNRAKEAVLTQFLQEMDGVASGNKPVLVLAATNHPDKLDNAILRRMPRRVYIGLPDKEGRIAIIEKLLVKETRRPDLNPKQISQIVGATDGYSGSDLTNLIKDAAMGPLRELTPDQVKTLPSEKIRAFNLNDIESSLKRIKPTVNKETLQFYRNWTLKFGDQACLNEPVISKSKPGYNFNIS